MKVLCIPKFHSSCRKCVIALLWCRKVINLVQNKIFSILILKFLVLKKLCFCVLRALNFLLSSFLSIKMCATGLERINSICSAHRNLSELWTWEKCFDSRFQAYQVFRTGKHVRISELQHETNNTRPYANIDLQTWIKIIGIGVIKKSILDSLFPTTSLSFSISTSYVWRSTKVLSWKQVWSHMKCILTYCLPILLFLRQMLLLHPGRLLKDSNNGGLHVRYSLHSEVLCTDSPPRSWVLVFQ